MAKRSSRSVAEKRPARRLVSMEEVAAFCGVDPRTVRRWIAEGRITGYRVGAWLVRVDMDEVEAKMIRPIPAAEAREMRA